MAFEGNRRSEKFGEYVVPLMGIGVQALELFSFVVALLAKEEVVTVLAHPAVLEDAFLAIETLVSFILLHLCLEDDLQLVVSLVPPHQCVVRVIRTLKIAFLA